MATDTDPMAGIPVDPLPPLGANIPSPPPQPTVLEELTTEWSDAKKWLADVEARLLKHLKGN